MKKREPVSKIMTETVITVDKDRNNLRDVKDIFRRERVRHIPVTSHGKLVGIISKNDINRLSFGALFENQADADEAVLDMLTIDQVMTHRPTVVSPDTLIREVAEIFANSDFHSLPVADGDRLVGIVTTTDVIRYMLQQYE
ncbi:MAG: CBS domain-containing protein [Chitinophagales bacterium]|nr:CBS domain-containing protein [Chitinophagales bacterium]MDW8418357.1 CBS domain-containing protein [Chitinophagales bacterium]